ncbi:hypothetical protein H9P43_005476 [Blastocladiella emersonii ATCC 22665]|nr:hypothetical protein H9P43_005476 [Blastocladiella emersonii ATCC 22665]
MDQSPPTKSLGRLAVLPPEVLGLIADHVTSLPDLRALLYCSHSTFALSAPRLWRSIWPMSSPLPIAALHVMTQTLWVARTPQSADYAGWVRELDLLALADGGDDEERHRRVLQYTPNVTRLAVDRASSAVAAVCGGEKVCPALRELVLYASPRGGGTDPAKPRTTFLGAHIAALLTAPVSQKRANLASINVNFEALHRIADLAVLADLAHRARRGELAGALPGLRAVSVTAEDPRMLSFGIALFAGAAAAAGSAGEETTGITELGIVQSTVHGSLAHAWGEAGSAGTGEPVPAIEAVLDAAPPLGDTIAACPVTTLRLGGIALSAATVEKWTEAGGGELPRRLQHLTLLGVEVASRAAWRAFLRLLPHSLTTLRVYRLTVVGAGAIDLAETALAAELDPTAPVALPCAWGNTLADLAASPNLVHADHGPLTGLGVHMRQVTPASATALAAVLAGSPRLKWLQVDVAGPGGREMDACIAALLRAVPLGVARVEVACGTAATIEVLSAAQAAAEDARDDGDDAEPPAVVQEADALPAGITQDDDGRRITFRGTAAIAAAREGKVEVRTYAVRWFPSLAARAAAM